jgi:DNA invertase Pin-like site-specific DNA recombinase
MTTTTTTTASVVLPAPRAGTSGMRLGYARVSTREQNPDHQLDALQAAGCDKVFCDKASGKLASRPEWDRLLEQARAGDQLVITRLDRAGRSVAHLVELAADLEARGVALVVLGQGIDTTTPAGRLTFHILAALGEFSAELIRENTRDGLAAAAARGRRGGRPTVMTPGKLAVARQLADAGVRPGEIARTIGVSRPTVYRHLEAAERSRSDPQPE